MTLWDAGEFITAAHTLGIPHPPGTPLFVMLGHVWGMVVVLGSYAWRLNLMSAAFSAAGAGCLFLVAYRLLEGDSRLARALGAAAAAITAAFCFTVWQNSNETEVYAIATFTICAIAVLALRWRDTRDPRYLVLVVYLLALSIGNHLLALLAGPAVVVFVAVTLRQRPAPDRRERQIEWAQCALLAAVWLLLVTVGLGKTTGFWVAAVIVLAALAWSVSAGARALPVMVLVAAAVGVSTYAFLYVRAGLDPILNEADPSTWDNLLAVIRREQYPPRTPLDNPIFPSGEGNPGRSPLLVVQQLFNYLQYFDWQWSRGLFLSVPAGLTPRFAFTIVFIALGAFGMRDLWRRDRGAFALLGTLWLTTGLGLVGYMNFKPGFSLFWDTYQSIEQHEVRERDYFFIASFQIWGLFAGLGMAAVARQLGAATRPRALAITALALVPVMLNWRAATRRGPDAQLGRDFAWDLLQSVGPYGVLFTYGDNDTFPVWYLQEVEGVRQDVSLVNLSLANTEWYLDQMRRQLPRPFDAANAPAVWRTAPVEQPREPVLTMPDSVFSRLRAFQQEQDLQLTVRGIPIRMRAGQTILPRDIAILMIIDQHLGKRPIAFGASAGAGEWLGLDRSIVERGLGAWIVRQPESLPGVIPGVSGLVDTALTRTLVEDVYRYGGLFEADSLVLDPAARQLAAALARPWLELAQAAITRRNQPQAVSYLRRALHLMPSRQLYELLTRIETEGLDALLQNRPEQPPPR